MTQRYLGSGTIGRQERGITGETPAYLPPRLTICLLDFSWYTRAGRGEPYEDLDAALAEIAARGFNTVRICAAPLLLFGDLGLEDLAEDLAIEGMGAAASGGYFGQRTRWYDTPGGYSIDLRARFDELFDSAARHGLVVILASWEYQQSPAFARSKRWFDAIDAVDLDERHATLAAAWDRLVAHVTERGHRQRIALVEMHNEVDFSILPSLGEGMPSVEWLATRHPDLLVTASYGKPPHLSMYEVPEGLGAAQFHVYSYGVLDALQEKLQIRGEGPVGFPNAELVPFLRADAPSFAEYGRAAEWKYRATVLTDRMFYGYDWSDADAWDGWLHDHFEVYRAVMLREVESRVVAVSRWARWQGVPALIGEGWIGYTPLEADFEEGQDGCRIAEHAVRVALSHGIWGMVLGSNVAPHHPSWKYEAWQRELNALILDGTPEQ